MRSRWYRSRLFWSGLVGLVILLVLWMVLREASYSVTLGKRGHLYSLSNSPADFYLGHDDLSAPIPRGAMGALNRFTQDWEKMDHKDLEYDMFGVPFHILMSRGSTYLFVAIWFVVAIYTVLWIGLLIWWQRRKQCLMTSPLDSLEASQ